MASTATPEAGDIRRRGRQRLIGAVALVALLVVFVPMLLDSEPRPAREGPTLAIPPKDPAKPLPMPAARAPDAAKGTAAAGKAAPDAALASPAADPSATPSPGGGQSAIPYTSGASTASTAGARSSASAPSAATRATVTAAAPGTPRTASPALPSAAPTAAAPIAQPPRSGFAVQVGAFRDEAKLKIERDKLAAARVPHYTERLDAKGGGLTRLRAGPFETRDQAEAALAKLKRASLDGKVVPLP